MLYVFQTLHKKFGNNQRCITRPALAARLPIQTITVVGWGGEGEGEGAGGDPRYCLLARVPVTMLLRMPIPNHHRFQTLPAC